MDQSLQDLIERSNRLGADKRVTNFAGGNTSAKLILVDPITGARVRVLAVKGSGGDLGTLTYDGLALLDLDRLLALEDSYNSGLHEDDIVALYEMCQFGGGGAVPSIDTPLHAFIDAPHVDHLHPDSMIALAAAAEGAELVEQCYGDGVGWLPWIRPGFELGLSLREFRTTNPQADAAVLGGHGMICWSETSEACETLSLKLIEDAEVFLAERGATQPFGPQRPTFAALEPGRRRQTASALAPHVRRVGTQDRAMVSSFTDAPVVLEFLASEAAPLLTSLGTSCPDHFLRTKVKPLFLDLTSEASMKEQIDSLSRLHRQYRADYQAYYAENALPDSPSMRGADPAIVLIPGVGMWSFGADAQTARAAGEFYINAINVMRGAESVSTYSPISDEEKFGIEYWELEERKLRMKPPPGELSGRVAFVAGGAGGIGRATALRLAELGACVVVGDLDGRGGAKVAAEIGVDRCLSLVCDVSDEGSVQSAFNDAALRFGSVDLLVNSAGFARSGALVDTDVNEWDELHNVLGRGSFLLSREAAKHMIASGARGDIVHIVSKNALAAGPSNAGYSSAKAGQAHLVRLLAVELGQHGIRVNGINPDGVVKGSGIFSGDWLKERADAYGVDPARLGEFYASRTLLGEEILPKHIADGVCALLTGSLSQTTGHILPVDGGLAAAFAR